MADINEQLDRLDQTLTAMEHDRGEDKYASAKKAMSELDEGDRKKMAQEILDEDKKASGKAASDDDEPEKKEASKKASDDDEPEKKEAASEDDEKDKKIAALTASVNYLTSKPVIDRMVEARRSAGMEEKALDSFSRSLYGQSPEQIKQRYAEDAALMASLRRSRPAAPPAQEIPFNGGLTASAQYEGKSLEEMF